MPGKSNTATKKKSGGKKKEDILVKLTNVRGNFLHIQTANERGEYADGKYSGHFLFPKATADEHGLRDLKIAVIKTGREFYQDATLKLKDIKHPIKDGDERYDKNPETYKNYKGMYYINPKSQYPIPIKGRDGVEELSEKDIKAGDYLNIVVNVYPYAQQGGGVTAGLRIVQFVKEGEAFGGTGHRAAAAMLGPIEVDLDGSEFDDVDIDGDEDEEIVEEEGEDDDDDGL